MVLRRLLNGYSNKRIQRDMQITKGALDSHIINLCRQHDVPDRHALVAKLGGPTSPPLNQHERAAQRRFQVQNLLLEGLPLKQIMQRLNLDRPTLMRDIASIYRHHDIKCGNAGPNSSRRSLAKKLGVDLPPTGAARLTAQIQSLHTSGIPIPQIAKQLNRCEAVIRRHLKRTAASSSSPAPGTPGEGRVRVLVPSPSGRGSG
jgi:DNA-binding NarL/FixJ family response regulator